MVGESRGGGDVRGLCEAVRRFGGCRRLGPYSVQQGISTVSRRVRVMSLVCGNVVNIPSAPPQASHLP